jgi:GNAT superfamily N-acetyltransferase
VIRTRQQSDLAECVAVLREVHEVDHYPMNWPADVEAWLTPTGMLTAWVAELPAGRIAGHLALQRDPEADDARAAEHPSAEVTRLFVTAPARRLSVASALLQHARSWVDDRGCRLTLEVVDTPQSGAIAFYESTGWRHTHTTMADWTTDTGDPVQLRHFVL